MPVLTDAPPLAPDATRPTARILPAPDFDAAAAFLDALASGGEFCFQTFDDSGKKRGALARQFHGSLAEHWPVLCRLNALGAGVFVTVNATDGQGRKAENVTGVRGVFVDFDTVATIEARLALVKNTIGIEPSLVVESSPGKHHFYWQTEGPPLPLNEFTALQQVLAAALDSDPVVKDPSRVMRLPGCVHRKGEPFVSRLIYEGPRTIAAALRVALAAYRPSEARPPPVLSRSNVSTTPYAARALESAANAVLIAPPGSRNDVLNTEAFGIFGLVKGGHLDEYEVRQTLERAATGAGLVAEEIQATLGSAWRAATPRDIPERSAPLPAASTPPPDAPPADDPPPPLDLERSKAKHLLASTPPPQRYVVDGLIPEPVTAAIVAPGSTGKSFWLMQLAACVATGTPFMGQAIPKPGAVLMLGAEDDKDEMARRLHSIVHEYQWSGDRLDRERLGESFYPVSVIGDDNRLTKHDGRDIIRDNAKVRRIITMAQAIPDLRLIILDPVSRFRSGDENDNEAATRFVETLEQIRKETGVTVLVAHHSRKGSQGNGADDIRGASAFVDALRWAATLSKPDAKSLKLKREEADKLVRFNVVKSNYRADVDELWMCRGVGGVLKPADPPAAPLAASQVRGDERYAEVLPRLVELVREKAKKGTLLTRSKLRREYGGSSNLFGVGKDVLEDIANRAISEGKLALRDDGTLHTW